MPDYDDLDGQDDADALRHIQRPGRLLARIQLGPAERLYLHWCGEDGGRPPSLRLWKGHREKDGAWQLQHGPSLYLKGEKTLRELIDVPPLNGSPGMGGARSGTARAPRGLVAC
jgi:hypothetical protein